MLSLKLSLFQLFQYQKLTKQNFLLSPLRVRKSDINYRYREEMTLYRTIKKRSKELMQKIKQRRLKKITLQGAIKKSNIAIEILEKKNNNNIFAFWGHQ